MKISNLKEKIFNCALIAALVAVMYLFDIPCLFLWLFKIPCPGCGITRAYISLLHLDMAKAFSYNPMFWSVPLLFILYLFDGKLFKKKALNAALLTVITAGFLVFWLIKLFF